MQSETTADLNAALAKAQSAMKAAAFNKTNPHFKNRYADLASVIDAIRDPLTANGLSYTQTTEIRDGGFVLVTTLRHGTGQWIASEYPLPIAAKPQELGSALTYARRYSLSAIACVAADDDDDAEGARKEDQRSSAPTPKPNVMQAKKESVPQEPQAIAASDFVEWGGLFVAAVGMANGEAEVNEWLSKNEVGLSALESSAPKVFDRVQKRIAEKRETFKKAA
jgi:hypothetical protein